MSLLMYAKNMRTAEQNTCMENMVENMNIGALSDTKEKKNRMIDTKKNVTMFHCILSSSMLAIVPSRSVM